MAEVVKTFPVPTRGVGLPDYSTAAPVGQVPVGAGRVYSSSDTGELAARLGSPVTFDRRGNVVWFDSFENGFNKWRIPPGSSGTVALSDARAYFGARSCKFTTAAVAGSYTAMTSYIHLPSLSKIGSAFILTPPDHGGVPNPDYELEFSIGFSDRAFSLRYLSYSPDNNRYQLALYTTGGWTNAYTITGDGLFNLFSYLFHTVKLVFDLATNKYERLIIDNMEYDISNYEAGVVPAAAPILYNTLLIRPVQAIAFTSYLDTAIVTQNEPINGV